MKRFSGWLVVAICFGYMIALLVVTLTWLHSWALREARASGMNVDDVFVVFPLRAWWVTLLLVPPLMLVAAWLLVRRARPAH